LVREESPFVGQFQYKQENLFVDFERNPHTDAGQARMIGSAVVETEAEETGQRATVSTPPGDAALRVDPFEVADEQHAKVNAGRNPGASGFGGVVRLAGLFNPAIEVTLVEQFVELVVEDVPRNIGERVGFDPELLLAILFFPSETHSIVIRFVEVEWCEKFSIVRDNNTAVNRLFQRAVKSDCLISFRMF